MAQVEQDGQRPSADPAAGDGPVVSIIVVTYNSARYVVETLESAKAQTWPHIELIVSDDHSTDDTVEVCRAWMAEHGARFTRVQVLVAAANGGIPANCNRGLRAARGDWLKHIAGDDTLLPDCIARYMAHAATHPDVEFMHCNAARYAGSLTEDRRLPDVDAVALRINRPDVTAREQFEILLRYNKVWAPSVIIRRSVFERVGEYDERVRLWEDLPMLLKVTAAGIKLHYLDFIGCRYRVNVDSVQQRRTDELLVSDFEAQMCRYYLDHYMTHLPLAERVVRGTLFRRSLAFRRLGLKRGHPLSRVLTKATAVPWVPLERWLVSRYI